MEKNTAAKWSRDQIQSLIDAYKKEECLYVVRHPNYHNKNVRAQAVARVTAKVCQVRPGTTGADCLKKMHSLRNQFNTENAKRKSSVRSGVCASDIYQPSLWYFDSMMFLENYFAPRKSTSRSFFNQSGNKTNISVTQAKSESVDEDAEVIILHSETDDYVAMNPIEHPEQSRSMSIMSVDRFLESQVQSQDKVCSQTRFEIGTPPALPPSPSPSNSSSSSQSSTSFEPLSRCFMPPPPKRAKKSNQVEKSSMRYILDKLDKFIDARINFRPCKKEVHLNPADPVASAMKYATDSLLNIKNKKRQVTTMHAILQIVRGAELEELLEAK